MRDELGTDGRGGKGPVFHPVARGPPKTHDNLNVRWATKRLVEAGTVAGRRASRNNSTSVSLPRKAMPHTQPETYTKSYTVFTCKKTYDVLSMR